MEIFGVIEFQGKINPVPGIPQIGIHDVILAKNRPKRSMARGPKATSPDVMPGKRIRNPCTVSE